MLSSGPNYSKLKTNLRLAISRLKLLEKKKTELAQKARREIAEYIASGKIDRAKIRVEHIIREDYMVEAMEYIEMYCDLLLARFGMIQQMKTIDEGLAEAIASLMWAAPRLQADVNELKIISDQLTYKFGKPYAQAAREGSIEAISEKLVHKLSIQAPPKILVEKYLIEIAKSHNVEYTSNLDALEEEEKDQSTDDATLIDLGPNNVYNPNFPFVVPPPIQLMQPTAHDGPPPLPTVPPTGPYSEMSNPPPIGFNIPKDSSFPTDVENSAGADQFMKNMPTPAPRTNLFQPINTMPELPSVPSTSFPISDPPNSNTSSDVDFDELTKRFEELKKKK